MAISSNRSLGNERDGPGESMRTFHPQWPDRAALDPGHMAFTFDLLSDTLYVDFDGSSHPAVSVQTEADFAVLDVYLRVDPVSEAAAGLQIVGIRAVPEIPRWLVGAVALAERQDEMAAPRTAAADRQVATVDALFAALAPAPG